MDRREQAGIFRYSGKPTVYKKGFADRLSRSEARASDTSKRKVEFDC